MSEIILPKFMNIGGGKITSVTDVLKKINCKNPLIITDKTMVKLNIIEPLEKALTDMQIRYKIFDDTMPEPTAKSIENGVSTLKDGSFDCIIAFGGGSPIDSAKAISLLAAKGGLIETYKFINKKMTLVDSDKLDNNTYIKLQYENDYLYFYNQFCDRETTFILTNIL